MDGHLLQLSFNYCLSKQMPDTFTPDSLSDAKTMLESKMPAC